MKMANSRKKYLSTEQIEKIQTAIPILIYCALILHIKYENNKSHR